MKKQTLLGSKSDNQKR